MREALALARAAWLTAASYRINLVLQLAGAAVSVVPLYFVAHALQPTMARSIGGQGSDYFGFVVVGLILYALVTAALQSLPAAIASGISSGTLEAQLATPAPVPAILAGLSTYGITLAVVRGVALAGVGLALGVTVRWQAMGASAVVVLLALACYVALGMLDAAVVVAFRLRTPFASVVLTLSALLGGVWYPTHVIPSWLRDLSGLVPLAHASRAVRVMLLDGRGMSAARDDVLMLAACAATLVAVGCLALDTAFRYARRHGTLGQY